jgi:hypothetical protein
LNDVRINDFSHCPNQPGLSTHNVIPLIHFLLFDLASFGL